MRIQELREGLSFATDEISAKDQGRLVRKAVAATEEMPLDLVVGT